LPTLALAWAGAGLGRAYFLSINVVAFCCYGYDKHPAVIGAARIPEMALPLLALIGGTVGALVGSFAFTRKQSFRTVFMLIVMIQVSALAFDRCALS